MISKFFKLYFCFLLLIISISSCSDFRKVVGKEKVIPDEFSVVITPSLLVPPGVSIDPEVIKNNNFINSKKEFDLSEKIKIKNKSDSVSFQELFVSKDIPKNIRKIVDEETLGISLSERRGIDILFGDIPNTGVVLDAKKEALRIRKNKSLGLKPNSSPSLAIEKSGKPLLIK